MKKLLLIFLLFGSLFLNNCTKNEKIEIIKIQEDKIEDQMIRAYQEGMTAFENRLYFDAAKKFNEAEILFPQSEWAPRSALMAAYAYYYDDYNNRAISELINFFKKYPDHPNTPYANYLLAMSYYNTIVDEKKDLEPLKNSKKQFEYIVENYPNTEFSLDSKFKLDLINEMIASKEMYIARHYIQKEKWIPAINRLKFIVTEYDNTVFIEEALHRLVEIYYKIGLEDESRKYAVLLGYNYPEGEWYKNTYKVHKKEYKIEDIKNENKKSTLKKLKSLLD
ncbi:outer membrane protein assembly factor BamD [Candidatus Pelagibacter communis]|uniref:outer membrane protein assembly factor BamD n=1 Tax=Pelagibacter ubique TaxID=198252 RepID=UPI00092D0C29|nr:outer membrane protein assembly factor BamD [Candidatus Pelagibacter ubique]